MISVKVSYTVNPTFAEQNKHNISVFLADFKKMSHCKFLYQVFTAADGLTFFHISMYEDEETQNQILNVTSFLQFQKERDESGLNDSHNVEILTMVGSSLSLLK